MKIESTPPCVSYQEYQDEGKNGQLAPLLSSEWVVSTDLSAMESPHLLQILPSQGKENQQNQLQAL